MLAVSGTNIGKYSQFTFDHDPVASIAKPIAHLTIVASQRRYLGPPTRLHGKLLEDHQAMHSNDNAMFARRGSSIRGKLAQRRQLDGIQ